jgi:tetratricopeptide (TPR) repeat protein
MNFAFGQINDTKELFSHGTNLLYAGQYQDAIGYFDKVLAIDQNNIQALNNKGFALSQLGQYQDAIGYFDKVLAIDPEFLDAIGNKGVILFLLGQYQDAIGYFDKVLAIDPTNSYAKENKQNAQAELNKTKDVNIIRKNWTLLPQQEIPDFDVSKGPKSLENNR